MTKSNTARQQASEVAAANDIRDLISFRLARLSTLNDRIAQKLISDRFGLSLREYRTLGTLGYLGDATTSVLARENFLDHAQVSRIVARMVDRGFVERIGSVTRGGALRLTEEGAELIEQGVAFAAIHNETLLRDMTGPDQHKLLQLVDMLIETAKARYDEVNGEISTFMPAFAATDTPPQNEDATGAD